MFKNIPFDRVNWITSVFLTVTLLLAVTAVPVYLMSVSVGAFTWCLFAFYIFATGFSITLGYHRLFSHIAFKAKAPIKWFVALFGAAAWENSIIDWCSDHRNHHKFVDHEDDDPYSITRGFWWAHMGWLMFKLKPEPPMDNVVDLEKDPICAWQHKYVHLVALVVGLILPAALCGLVYGSWMAALGGFLLVGILRTVIVQHSTFLINSACHYFGGQPYSSKHSSRDSWWIALLTFGEGYHNYHHEFQHDYRNGVKAWQFDPTKWIIWTLSCFGLTTGLRRVNESKILLAELTEAQRKIASGLEMCEHADFAVAAKQRISASIEALQQTQERLAERYYQLQKNAADKVEVSKAKIREWRNEIQEAMQELEAVTQFDLAGKAI